MLPCGFEICVLKALSSNVSNVYYYKLNYHLQLHSQKVSSLSNVSKKSAYNSKVGACVEPDCRQKTTGTGSIIIFLKSCVVNNIKRKVEKTSQHHEAKVCKIAIVDRKVANQRRLAYLSFRLRS